MKVGTLHLVHDQGQWVGPVQRPGSSGNSMRAAMIGLQANQVGRENIQPGYVGQGWTCRGVGIKEGGKKLSCDLSSGTQSYQISESSKSKNIMTKGDKKSSVLCCHVSNIFFCLEYTSGRQKAVTMTT